MLSLLSLKLCSIIDPLIQEINILLKLIKIYNTFSEETNERKNIRNVFSLFTESKSAIDLVVNYKWVQV